MRSCSTTQKHYIFNGVLWTFYFILVPQETLQWQGMDSRRARRGSVWSLFYSVRTAVARTTGQLAPAMIASHEKNETRITWHSTPPWQCVSQDVLKNCRGSTFVAHFYSLELAGTLHLSHRLTVKSHEFCPECIYELDRILKVSNNYFYTQH